MLKTVVPFSARPLVGALLAGALLAALAATPATAQQDDYSGSGTTPPANRVQVGQEAPDFALPDLDGDTHRLSDLEGDKPLVLVFFRGAW